MSTSSGNLETDALPIRAIERHADMPRNRVEMDRLAALQFRAGEAVIEIARDIERSDARIVGIVEPQARAQLLPANLPDGGGHGGFSQSGGYQDRSQDPLWPESGDEAFPIMGKTPSIYHGVFFGIGEDGIAVTWQVLEVVTGMDLFILHAPKRVIENAPEIGTDDLSAAGCL